jgi:hypothetical protein
MLFKNAHTLRKRCSPNRKELDQRESRDEAADVGSISHAALLCSAAENSESAD